MVAARGDVVVNASPGWHVCTTAQAWVPIGGLPAQQSNDGFHWCADPGPSWSGVAAGPAVNGYAGILY